MGPNGLRAGIGEIVIGLWRSKVKLVVVAPWINPAVGPTGKVLPLKSVR